MASDRSARATLWSAIRVIAATLLLGYLLTHYDIVELARGWDARVGAGVALTFLTLLGAQLLSALRWRIVLGVGSPPVRELFPIYLVGVFFSLFLPTSVGGDAARALGVTRRGVPALRAGSSVVLDRVLGMIALGVLLAAGLVATTLVDGWALPAVAGLRLDGRGSPALGVGLALAGVGGLLAYRSTRLRRMVVEAMRVWTELGRRPSALLGALVVALAVQLAYVVAWGVLAWSLGIDIPVVALLVYVPCISLAGMIPITISGLGVREGAWALLLAPHGIASADAVAYGLLYFVTLVLVGGVGAAALARWRQSSPATAESAPGDRSGVRPGARRSPAAVGSTPL